MCLHSKLVRENDMDAFLSEFIQKWFTFFRGGRNDRIDLRKICKQIYTGMIKLAVVKHSDHLFCRGNHRLLYHCFQNYTRC